MKRDLTHLSIGWRQTQDRGEGHRTTFPGMPYLVALESKNGQTTVFIATRFFLGGRSAHSDTGVLGDSDPA
jgi:hypothetical protein